MSSLDPDNPLIKINIGGQIFQSYKQTFEQSSYLSKMFKFHSDKTDFTDQFIDRDTKIFELLLNCMRDTNYITTATTDIAKYSPDITFFQIETLISYLEKNSKNNNDQIIIKQISPSMNMQQVNDNFYQFAIMYKTKLLYTDYVTIYNQPAEYELGVDIYIPDGYMGIWVPMDPYQQNFSLLIDSYLLPGEHKNVKIKIKPNGYYITIKYDDPVIGLYFIKPEKVKFSPMHKIENK